MLFALLSIALQQVIASSIPKGRFVTYQSLLGQHLKAMVTFDEHNTYHLEIHFETTILGSYQVIDCSNEFYMFEGPERAILETSGFCKRSSEQTLGVEMRRIAYFADSNIVNLTLGYLSFDISLDLTAEIGVAACSSNPRCAGLGGDCCPTSSGVYLDCCSQSCTPIGQDPWQTHSYVACCSNSQKVLVDSHYLCAPLCTGEGGDTWAYHKHIDCCAGLVEKNVNGRLLCEKSGDTCTPENGDPWATGSFVACCAGLEKVLIDGHYKCVEPGPDPPSGYTNHFDPNNPLNVQVKGSRSDNYFLIIGDWGRADNPGYCQKKVSQMMVDYVNQQKEAGKNLMFVATVGDNFYWTGAAPYKWKNIWMQEYAEQDQSSPLYNIPWLASRGNHDYGNDDPYAFCPNVHPYANYKGQNYASYQFNSDRNPSRPENTGNYWQPDFNYYYSIPDASLEVIVIDQNIYDFDGIGGDYHGVTQAYPKCGNGDYNKGKQIAHDFLTQIAQSGEELLKQRASESNASTILVIQHYPSRARAVQDIFASAGGSRNQIFAYGHVHTQQCQGENSYGQCNMILTGGGGGCCSADVQHAGFTAVHLTQSGYTVDVTSNAVRLNTQQCPWS